MKLARAGCVLVGLLALSGCSGHHEQLVRRGDVVREFKAHGIVLQNVHVYGDKDAITGGYFLASPPLAKVTLFVAVCRSEEIARKLALRRQSPLPRTAAVERRKNVVLYLTPELDPHSRREATEALRSL